MTGELNLSIHMKGSFIVR